MFKFLKKKKHDQHHRLLNEGEEDLQKCDLCENMQIKLKKCENCNEKKLCNSCLETEKLCNNCEIAYKKFCKALRRAKVSTEMQKYSELL